MSVLVTWSSLHIPAIFATLSLSTLWPYESEAGAGCYCCVVFWWLFRPITVLVGVRYKPGLSSPPLALDMCKQNICMANITNTTNATSLFSATLVLAAISKIHGCFIWRCGTTELSLSGIPGQGAQADQEGPAVTQLVRYRFSARDRYLEARSHTWAQGERRESLHQPEWQW